MLQKSMEMQKDVLISGSNHHLQTSRQSSSDRSTKKKAKCLYPPIETYWQLPPVKEQKKLPGFVKLLSSPSKYMESLRLSKKFVIEGPHNPKDEIHVNLFRDLLHREGKLLEKNCDYHTLLRFLRMRDFDLYKAKDVFLQYLKWREDFNVDRLPMEFNFEELDEVRKCYPHGFHGVDRDGRPVYIVRIGMVDMDGLLQVTTIDRFVKHHVLEQERTLNCRYPACSLAAKKHIASTVSILDVSGVGKAQFSKPARYLFMEIQKIDSCYYPETLHRLFIVNAGARFRVLWKAIRLFLDARTLAKIRVLGTDYKSSLLKAIDPSNLPSFLGGECTCSGGEGGCLSSDKGPWNDREIAEMLQAMLCTRGDDHECDKCKARDASDEQSPYPAQVDSDRFQGASTSLAQDQQQPLLRKIQDIGPLLDDAKQKMGILEGALEDTKLVLNGLAEHIEELKR